MKLANRLRAIADLLEFLEQSGLKNQASPLYDNEIIEITESAYDSCSCCLKGQKLIKTLQSDGVDFLVHEEVPM